MARLACNAFLLVVTLCFSSDYLSFEVMAYDWGGNHRHEQQQQRQSSRFVSEAKVADARNDFAFRMFEKLREKNTSENVFFSPYSISSAMSMLLLGTRGQTEGELRRGLEYGDWEGIHEGNQDIREKIGEKVPGFILRTANRLFPDTSFRIHKSYVDECEKFYGSEVQEMDFVRHSEESRKKINEWVEDQTNNKIKDLMPKGTIDPSTVLVLANAIYFKGKWAEEFNKDRTTKADFFVSESSKKRVDMMGKKAKYQYGESKDLGVKILELPYRGDTSSMILVLPDERFGLEAVEKELTAEKLLKIRTDREEVVVQLPKFKLEFGSDLVGIFQDLKVRRIFGPSADFGGISDSRNLFVSAIQHKAFVEVNEEGTEAAAATGISMARMAMPAPAIQFICDHPFLFFIKHHPTNLILFAGRYVKPEA